MSAAMSGERTLAIDKLSRFVASRGRLDLLWRDELNQVHLDPRGVELLFQILTEREERASVAVTANTPFSEWRQTLDHPWPDAADCFTLPAPLRPAPTLSARDRK